MHLILDGHSSDRQILEDEKALYKLLDVLPAQVGMTKILGPFVTRYEGPVPEDWGISGFVVIAESHIAVHTFVEQLYVNIDVFSCKDFEAQKVLEALKDRFRLTEVRSYLLGRAGPGLLLPGYGRVVELCRHE